MNLLLGTGTIGMRCAGQKLPRVGFVGTGNLLAALRQSGLVKIVGALGGISRENRYGAPDVPCVPSLNQLLEMDLDGLVLAKGWPHPMDHALAGLEHGVAVFCPSPVGWNLVAARQAASTARERNCLLAVDFPYRRLTGAGRIRELLRQKELGTIFSADFVFHSARRPRQSWFDGAAGEGCATGLGFHLIDLALWCLDYPTVVGVSSQLLAQGQPIHQSEDFAAVRLTLHTGASIQISCSWKLPRGCGTVISGTFCGTKGTAQFHNVGGSLSRFGAWRVQPGSGREPLMGPLRPRHATAALEWARHLAERNAYDSAIEGLVATAATLERMRCERAGATAGIFSK